MTELLLRGLRVSHEGSTFDGVDCEASGNRIALVGGFQPLFAMATGRARAAAGSATVGGLDVRQAVLSGELGVADPTLEPLPGKTVVEWLTAYARLRGEPRDLALHMANSALERLGISYLGRYQSQGLPPASRYAARIALAALTRPRVVLVDAPSWTAEGAPIENAVLAAMGEQAALLLCCDPSRQPELFLSCDAGIILVQGEAVCVVPQEQWQGRRHYVVAAIDNHDAMVAHLEQAGAAVVRPSATGEMWVTLPDAHGPELVLEAALASRSGLRRMSPLFERPPEG